MEARLSKGEIEKVIKKHLIHSTPIRWEGSDLILEVNSLKLRKEEIDGTTVFMFGKQMVIDCGKYAICPIIKKDDTRFFIVIQ